MNVYDEYNRLYTEADAMWQAFLQKLVAEGFRIENAMQHPDFEPAIAAQRKANEFYESNIRNSKGD